MSYSISVCTAYDPLEAPEVQVTIIHNDNGTPKALGMKTFPSGMNFDRKAVRAFALELIANHKSMLCAVDSVEKSIPEIEAELNVMLTPLGSH